MISLRHVGKVIRTDRGRPGKSHSIWSLGTPKTIPGGGDPCITDEDPCITDEDLEWQQFWLGRHLERQRRAIRSRGML